jgi:hypothetical protein
MKYKKISLLCLVLIIAILGLNTFKITPSNIKGVISLEKTQQKYMTKTMDTRSQWKVKANTNI